MDIRFNCPRCGQNLSVEERGAGMLVNCPNCQEQIEIPRNATAQVLNISLASAPEKPESPPQPSQPPPLPPLTTTPPIPPQQAKLHTIKVGRRTIVLPDPDEGCQRCDHLGKPPLVPSSFRQRLLAFFMAGDATETQPRYFYVQCARFIAGVNETRETYAKLQAAIVRRDQGKASIFDVTEDSLCMWNFYAPINMIFTSCMMLVAGRVLYLYGMCHSQLTRTEREQLVIKSWRDRIIKANPDESCMSECEEIATTINGLVKAGHIPKAQQLLELSLNDYFVLQLAMFADKKVNAYITIAAWKQAGLRLPAEDTAEFFPYGDSPSIAEEQSKAEAPTSKQERASKTSDVPQEERDREGGIKPNEPIDWRKVAFGPADVSHGVGLIRRGIRDYPSWSEQMVSKYGESIRERLTKIYTEAKIQAAAVDAMQEESRQLLGPSVWKALEDAAWSSNAVKDEAMLALKTAYSDLKAWDAQRLRLAVEGIAIFTVKEILGAIEQLPKQVRDQCRSANNTKEALDATFAAQSATFECMKSAAPGHPFWEIERVADQMGNAAMEASGGAIKAAWALHESALAAAKAADAAKKCGAEPDDVLRRACRIWIAAAEWSAHEAQQSTNNRET
jgi:hypothetical protein